MNSTLFLVAVGCTMVGAIGGMIAKHIQDTKHIKALSDFSLQHMRKITREDEEVIRGLYAKIERLTAENNRLQAERAISSKPISFRETEKFFEDLCKEALPEDNGIDVGGNF